MVISIVILAVVWLLVMFYRMEIRAHWWAYRLQHSNSVEQRQYYFSCLASVGDRSLTALPRLLEDTRAEVRLWGVRLLRWCPGERARDLLIAHVADESDEVSAQVALEIARRADRFETLPMLEGIVQTSDPPAVRIAVAAIERIGGPQAEAILLKQMDTADDANLLAQVIDSVGMLGCRQAIPKLKQLLDDKRAITILPVSQQRAQKAIAHVRGQLSAKGIDPQAVLDATHSDSTVADVAQRALHLITGQYAVTTQPDQPD